MKYRTIYGELVVGKIEKELENTVIIHTNRGERYLVHKLDLNNNLNKTFKFNLKECQLNGKPPEYSFI